jgi:hypothetical protein
VRQAGFMPFPFASALLMVLSFVGFALPAHALRHDLQLWTGFYFQGPTDSATNLYVEVQPRFGSNVGRLSTILVRSALVYHVNAHSTLWAGHGWTPSFDHGFKDEQRLWQQYQYTDNWRGHSWAVRFRLEERFIQALSLAWRLRVMGRFSHPISGPDFEALVWDELFWNINSVASGPSGGFDRNRVFVGVNWEYHPKMSLELGYMNQIAATVPEGAMAHNITVYSWVRF